jgi:hypothetical protein
MAPVDLAGILAPKPSPAAILRTGVVATLLTGNRITVNINGVNVSMRRGLHFTPAVGDVVLVATTGIGDSWAIMAIATGTAPTPVPAPPATPSNGYITWPALDAGTWRAGARRTDRSDVLAGDDGGGVNTGAWFYGDAIAASMGGLTATSAYMCIDRRDGSSGDPIPISLYLHNSTAAPTSGAPVSIAGPTDIGNVALGQLTWLQVPLAWVNQIIAGTAAGLGITRSAAGWLGLASLEQSGQTGALLINYST